MKAFSLILVNLFLSAAAFAGEQPFNYQKEVELTQWVCPQAVQADNFPSSCKQTAHFYTVSVPVIPTIQKDNGGPPHLLPGQPDPGPSQAVDRITWYGKLDQRIPTPQGNFIVRIEVSGFQLEGVEGMSPINDVAVSILSDKGNILSQMNAPRVDGITLTVITRTTSKQFVYTQVMLENPLPIPLPGITGNN